MTGPDVLAAVLGRGIAFPLGVDATGRLRRSAGLDNVEQAIGLILLTQTGERMRRPDVGAGLGEVLFAPNTLATHRLIEERVQTALAAHEPRITVEAVRVEEGLLEDADPYLSDVVGPRETVTDPRDAVTVTVAYRLVATGAPGRVRVPLRGIVG